MALDSITAITDVVDFEVQDYVTRDLLFSVDYAEEVKFGTDAELLEIKGGIGNPVRITENHSKTAEFGSVLPLVDINALGVKLGRRVTGGSYVVPKSEVLVIDESHDALLFREPIGKTLKVYLLEANGRDIKNELLPVESAPEVGEYTISGNKITLNDGVGANERLKVLYDYNSGENAKLVRVTAGDFPGYCRITGMGYLVDQSGNKAPVSFIAHRCKPTPEFELLFKAGEATTIPFNCKITANLVGREQVFFDIIPLPDEGFIPGTLVDAVMPVIVGAMEDVETTEGVPVALNATATVTDGGTISYQWYEAVSEDAEGEVIVSADSAIYLPDVGSASETYYYCIVTNTNDNVTGEKEVSIKSKVVKVNVTN